MPAKVEVALAVSKKRKAIRVFLYVMFCLFLVLPIIASNVQGLSNFHKMKTSAESNVTILWTAPAAWGSGVAISDNGEYVAFVNGTYSYSDYTYRYYLVLMTKSGQKVFEIPLNAESWGDYISESENVDISGDGSYIVVGCGNSIKVYKNTSELYFEYNYSLPNGIHKYSVSISKDGKLAVVGTGNGIYIFDVVNKRLTKHYLIGNVWSTSTAISDNGEYIACGCSDSTQNYVYVFNRNGEKIWEKSLSLGEYQEVERVQISNNGLLAVSCSDSVFVFDVLNDKLIFSRHTGDYTHPHVGVSPDGTYFVFAKEETINNADTIYRFLVVSLYSKDGTEIWRKEVSRSEGAGYWGYGILGIRVSNNADWILVLGSGWGSPLVLFDKNGNEIFRYELPYYRFDLDMTSDGKYFAISSSIVFFQNNLVAERNQPPVADFTYTPQQPRVDEEITFDASSSYDPDGQIVEYEWDFGDGTVITTTEPVVDHTYTQPGNYTVKLTVVDNDGLTASIFKIVRVTSETKTITLRFVNYLDYSPVILLKVKLLKDGKVINEKYTDKTGNVTFVISDDLSKYRIEYLNTLSVIPEHYLIEVPPKNLTHISIYEIKYNDDGTIRNLYGDCSNCLVRITSDGVDYLFNSTEIKWGIYIPYENITCSVTVSKVTVSKCIDIISFELNPTWIPRSSEGYCTGIVIHVPSFDSSNFRVIHTDFNPIRDAYSFINFETEVSESGSCYGMVSTAKLFFEERYNKSRYDGEYDKIRIEWIHKEPPASLPDVSAFIVKENGKPVIKTIADYLLAILLYHEYQSKTHSVIPADEALKRLNYGEPVGIALWKWNIGIPLRVGHELLAIGYIQVGNIIYFEVYDPNHPRSIEWLRYDKVTGKFDHYGGFTNIEFHVFRPLKYDDVKDFLGGESKVADNLLNNFRVAMSSNRLKLEACEGSMCALAGYFDEEGVFRTIPFIFNNVAGFMNYVKDESGKIEDTFYAVAYPKYSKIRITTEDSQPSKLDPLTIVSFSSEGTTGMTIEAETNIMVNDTGTEYVVKAGGNVTITTFNELGTRKVKILGNDNTVLHINQNLEEVKVDVNGDGTINSVPPIPRFEYSFTGQTITFDASSSYDPDGCIVKYIWNFGNGNVTITTNPAVSHVYTQPRSYTVTLTVTDNDGLSSSITRTVDLTLKEIIPDNIPDNLEQILSKYCKDFDWRTQAPTKQDTLNAIINAINQYFNTNTPSIRQQILNDIISLINLYFQL